MSVKIEFHGRNDNGKDALTAKPGKVFVVTFEDGTVTRGELSMKSIGQLLEMKLGQIGKAERTGSVPTAAPSNGSPV